MFIIKQMTKQICSNFSMEEQIDYILNYVMIIEVHVLNMDPPEDE